MATTLDPVGLNPIDVLPSGDVIGAARWRRLALLALTTLLICTISAWWGYRRQVDPAPANPAALAQAAADNTGSPAVGSLADNEEIVVDSAPSANPSALPWPMWEFRLRQPIPPRDPSLTPPTWRLIGSALSNGKWAVIVLRQGSTTPEYFGVGQELPGGYRIESINDEDVTLAQGKRSMVLSYIGSR